MAPRRSTLAKAALARLNDIHALAEENRALLGNADAHQTLEHQARSAADAIKVVRAYDANMLPDWLIRDWAYFRTLRWHNDAVPPRAK
jgi:hypothetical protein